MKTLTKIALAALTVLVLTSPALASRRCRPAWFTAASPAIEQAIKTYLPATEAAEVRCEARWNGVVIVSFNASPRLRDCSRSFAVVNVRGTRQANVAAVFCGGSTRPELYTPAD